MTTTYNDGKLGFMYNLIPLIVAAVLVVVNVTSAPADQSITQVSQRSLEREHLNIVKTDRDIEAVGEELQKVYGPKDQMSPLDLKQLLITVGFEGEALRQAWGTAMKESTGRPMAHNRNSKTGDNSYGLFQINMIGSLGPARLEKYGLKSNEDLFDPMTNAKIAYQMSNGGKDWSAWHGITERTQQWMQEFPG